MFCSHVHDSLGSTFRSSRGQVIEMKEVIKSLCCHVIALNESNQSVNSDVDCVLGNR